MPAGAPKAVFKLVFAWSARISAMAEERALRKNARKKHFRCKGNGYVYPWFHSAGTLDSHETVIGFGKSLRMAAKRKSTFDPKNFLTKAGNGRHITKYRKGQVIFSQGEVADSVGYIQQGKVKLTVVSPQGKEAVVAMLGVNDFFGEGSLAGQRHRMATVTAMTDCAIMHLEKGTIVSMLHKEPAFSELFMTHLLGRSVRVEADLVDQLFNSSEKRLARLLLLLANFGKEGKPEPIIAKISQETLAEMIGTTRSRVSFFMNKFRDMGLIEYNGGIKVHSSLLNLVLHEQPEIKV